MLLDYVKRFQLPLFFTLCLAISWTVWIPEAVATLNNREAAIAGGGLLDVLAVWAPALSAILLSLMAGKTGVQALFRPIHRWRVGIQWYFFVLFYPAAIWLIARVVDIMLGQSYELPFMPILTYFGPGQAFMVIIALVFALPNTLGEELGWRGFALPLLQKKYNALVSSVILGIFWGFWHIPLWIAFGQTALSLFMNVVGIVGIAILFTWVYNSTEDSLLLVWLFHFAMTVTGYFLSPIPTYTDEILGWVIVVIIIYVAGARHLSRK